MLDPAARAELRHRIDAARRAQAQPPACKWGDSERRGTHLGYASGCRCHDCREAHRLYKRERRALLRELQP